MTQAQQDRVRRLIESRRMTERSTTTWDGDPRMRERVETTDALEALLRAVTTPAESPAAIVQFGTGTIYDPTAEAEIARHNIYTSRHASED